MEKIPKYAIAAIAILAAIALFFIANPPHTACDSQVEAFFQSQEKLFIEPVIAQNKTPSQLSRLQSLCKIANSPGGCYEYFIALRKLLVDMHTISSSCSSTIGQNDKMKLVIVESMTLMIELAWGARPPSSEEVRLGWFNAYDLTLFCDLKDKMFEYFGENEWRTLFEKISKSLPGSQTMDSKKVWPLTIMAINCQSYRS